MQLIFELLLLRTIAAPEFEQMRGRLGWLHAARLPLEQHGAEFVFEQFDLPRDHGRRCVDAFGGATDGAVREHLVEIAKALLVDLSHINTRLRWLCCS